MREGGSRTDAICSLKDQEKKLRSALEIPYPTSKPEKAEFMREIRLNNNSKMALAYAAEEAKLDDSFDIDTDHLLRGILRFPNEATGALQSISLDLATAQVISRRNRAEFPQKKTFYQQLFGSPIQAHKVIFMKLLAVVIVLILSTLLIRWLN